MLSKVSRRSHGWHPGRSPLHSSHAGHPPHREHNVLDYLTNHDISHDHRNPHETFPHSDNWQVPTSLDRSDQLPSPRGSRQPQTEAVEQEVDDVEQQQDQTFDTTSPSNAQLGEKLQRTTSWKGFHEAVEKTPEESTGQQKANRANRRRHSPFQLDSQPTRNRRRNSPLMTPPQTDHQPAQSRINRRRNSPLTCPQSEHQPAQPPCQIHVSHKKKEKKGKQNCLRSLCCESLRLLIASVAGFVAVASLSWATVCQLQQPLAFILPAVLGSLSIWALVLQRECHMVAVRTSELHDQRFAVQEHCIPATCGSVTLERSLDGTGGRDAELGVSPSLDTPALSVEAPVYSAGNDGEGATTDHILAAALVSEYLRSARELRHYQERYGESQELPLVRKERFSNEWVNHPPLHMDNVPQPCLSDDLLSKVDPAVETTKTFEPASRASQLAPAVSPATAASFSRAAAWAERAHAMEGEVPMVSLNRART